jgi:HEAT repeat protein
MQDNTKTDAPRQTAPSAGRPPPLPSSKAKPVAGGGQLAKARAFLEIRRLRLSNALRDLGHRVRRHKLAAGIGGTAVALAVAGGLAFAFDALPDLDFAFSSPETVAEATRNVREHPSDAGAQRDLGHALFAAKRRAGGVAAYRHALTLDAGAGDERMVKNLLSCFGTPQQDAAEDAIWKNKLVEAQQGLEALVSSRRSSVRWGAVQTLDRLRKGTKANWETAYILDLDSSKCEVRRRAVEKLGDIGAQRAVKALRAAKADDEKTGGWFSSRCLGDRLETAEKQIVARR